MNKNTLNHKIDFAALISVTMANPNGDPLDGNRPRIDYEDFGEISDVCIKRKIRNRMMDLKYDVFVQSDDKNEDGCESLKARAEKYLPEIKNKKNQKMTLEEKEAYVAEACKKYIDIRSFGQVFAISKTEKKNNSEDSEESGSDSGVSISARGPVTIHQARSVSPVDIVSFQITKSVKGSSNESRSDTMGMKHFVRYGLYVLKGSINVQLAEKTEFTTEDADVIKECLRTLFMNDASSARPDGSMEVVKLYWWEHNCKEGQYSSAKVHRLLEVKQKNTSEIPKSIDDFEITLNSLDGLHCEEIAGY